MALLSLPALILILALAERAIRILPDEVCAVFVPLLVLASLASPVCGVLCLIYPWLAARRPVPIVLGTVLGIAMVWLSVTIIVAADRWLSMFAELARAD